MVVAGLGQGAGQVVMVWKGSSGSYGGYNDAGGYF